MVLIKITFVTIVPCVIDKRVNFKGMNFDFFPKIKVHEGY